MSSILFYSTRMKKKIEKGHFSQIFFWSPISRIVPKSVEGSLKKAYLTSISSASRSSVAFSVSSSQLIKPLKSVTSLVFKEKSLLKSAFFYEKAPTKELFLQLKLRKVYKLLSARKFFKLVEEQVLSSITPLKNH